MDFHPIDAVSDQRQTSFNSSCGTFGDVNKEIFKQDSAKKGKLGLKISYKLGLNQANLFNRNQRIAC